MNKFFVALTILVIFFSVGCSSHNPIDRSGKNEIVALIDQVVQDDFIFRLMSEKEQYEVGEEVNLYGEIEYIGNEKRVTIHHSSSAILFPIKEEIRGYEIEAIVNTVGKTTTLNKGKPYREKYSKTGGYSPGHDPQDYISFMKDFLNRNDFPTGHYVVNGYAYFSVISEDGDNEKRYKIEAKIEFTVD